MSAALEQIGDVLAGVGAELDRIVERTRGRLVAVDFAQGDARLAACQQSSVGSVEAPPPP